MARAVTFLLNILIARLATPTAFGLGFVSLQLFSNLTLFATREGFRKVALRVPSTKSEAAHEAALQSAANLGWMGFATAVAVVAPLSAYWISTSPSAATSSYTLAVSLMAVASVVEAAAEPFLIRVLVAQHFRSRAVGEGAAIMVRTVAMLLLTMALDDVPLAFAASQLLYSLTWLGWFGFGPGAVVVAKALLPAKLDGERLLAAEHEALLGEFGGMVLLKLVLTEGEKILLLALFSEEDWGVFGLVSNLGSIVVRLLFAPTEEIAYSAFSAAGAAGDGQDGQRPRDGRWGLLRALLLLQGGIGWLGLCFGPGFAHLAIRILYGPAWASSKAPSVLAAYCVLLFSMALNGILEAFMYSQCPPAWVRICNGWQLLFSIVLVVVSWVGRSHGPIALVWANCSAMLLRACLGIAFAMRHLPPPQPNQLRLLPAGKLLGSVLLGGVLCTLLVPDLPEEGHVPWAKAAMAILALASAIASAAFLNRQEIRATLGEVRQRHAE